MNKFEDEFLDNDGCDCDTVYCENCGDCCRHWPCSCDMYEEEEEE